METDLETITQQSISKLIPYKNIPQTLRDEPRWVLWKLETRHDEKKPTKVPYQVSGARADSTKPNTWSTFEDVWQVYYDDVEQVYSGVGCVISEPYIGIDLDGCRDAETAVVEPWALDVLKDLNSYTELSPSGRGFHIWVKGQIPENRKTAKIEIYSKERYFTVSGEHFAGTPKEIKERDLASFIEKYLSKKENTTLSKDDSPSAKEFRILCDLWKKHGQNTSENDIVLEFFKKAEYREKWDRNRQYVTRSVRAAKSKVFGSTENRISKLNTIRFSHIPSKKVEWLWENRIPKGKLTMFFGNPDCGKTGVLCDILARFTNQTVFPDDAPVNENGEVLLMSAEDDPEDTLRPRLEAAGADLNKIHYVRGVMIETKAKSEEREIALDTDLQMLENCLLQNNKVKIVAIDPISSYFGNADLNKEQNIRKVLGPIKKLAEKTKVTFICVGHFNKRQDVGALHRAGGAVAMTGVARSVWLFMKDPEVDNQFLMLLGKGNLTRKREGLKYMITSRGDSSAIIWQGVDTRDADVVADALKDPIERARMRAERFLRDITTPMPAEDAYKAADALGIKSRTLETVKKELRMESLKKDKTWWWLPLTKTATSEPEMTCDDVAMLRCCDVEEVDI